MFANDAFISYSRKDAVFARALEAALERYLPPKSLDVPHRRLVVFRDEDDFSGTEYHRSLDRHIQDSDKLIVICSPFSRASSYVNDEIGRFAKVRGADHIIPVLLSGLANNEATPADEALKAYPDALCDVMAMPLAADYRGFVPGKSKINSGPYQGAWYSILGNIYGRSRADVEQRDLKSRRRRRRLVGVVAAAVAATILSIGAAAWLQRQAAARQERLATARELAARAADVGQDDPGRDFRVGVLLAAESLQHEWTEQGYSVWRRLSARMPTVLADAPTDSVSLDLAFTPGGKNLLVLCGERHVHVLSIPDLKQVRMFEADQSSYNLTIDQAGDRVAVYQMDGSIQVFDIDRDGPPVNILAEPKEVVFDGSGRVVVRSDGAISVYDPTTGKPAGNFPLPPQPIAATLSPDGSMAAVLTTKQLSALDLRDGSVRWTVGQPAKEPFGRAIFSSDSRHLLAIGRATVSILESSRGSAVRSEPVPDPRSQVPASVFTGGDIYLLDGWAHRVSQAGALSMVFAGQTRDQLPRDPVISPAGGHIAGLDGQERPEYAIADAYAVERGLPLRFTLDRGQITRRVAFDATGRRLALATFERGGPGAKLPSGIQLIALDQAAWPPTVTTARRPSVKREFDVSRDGDLVVVADRETGETIGYSGDGKRRWTSDEKDQLGPGPAIMLSPTGRLLARHSNARGWVITDLSSKRAIVIKQHGPFAFSPDEKRVLIGARVYTLDRPDAPVDVSTAGYFNRLWARSGSNYVVAEQAADGVVRGFALFDWRTAAVSTLPAGTQYAVDDDDKRIAAITDGALEIRRLDKLSTPVASTKFNPLLVRDHEAMWFSPDGRWLAVAVPRAINVYDAATLEKRFEVPLVVDESLAGFSRDGAYLVTYSWRDGFPQAMLNPITISGIIAETCSKVRRPLAPAEWRQFSPKTIPHDTCQ